jgi:hypothetical protein
MKVAAISTSAADAMILLRAMEWMGRLGWEGVKDRKFGHVPDIAEEEEPLTRLRALR